VIVTLLNDQRTPADFFPSRLVDEDAERHRFRVHRSAMTSPQVYAAELANVFARCWLYAGHESEIPELGDYVRRRVGGRPIFLVRGAKSQCHLA
jgi:p-cumate 2,3-dioxygenase alpha subunit